MQAAAVQNPVKWIKKLSYNLLAVTVIQAWQVYLSLEKIFLLVCVCVCVCAAAVAAAEQ